MGILEKAIYRVIPKLNDFEQKIEGVIASGKEVIDDFKNGVDYGRNFAGNVDDYIGSGKPLGYFDKAADTLVKDISQVLKGAFSEMKDDFNRKYWVGRAGSGRAGSGSIGSTISRHVAKPTPKPVAAKPTYKPAPGNESDIGTQGSGIGKQQPGTSQASQPYAGHKPLGHDYMKGVLRDIKEVVDGDKAKNTGQQKPAEQPIGMPKAQPTYKPEAKPAVQPAKPAYEPAKEQVGQPIMQPAVKPAYKPVEKQLTLDSIVDDFKRKLKALSPDIDADVDVYAPGGLLQSYASKYAYKKAGGTAGVFGAGAAGVVDRDESVIDAKANQPILMQKSLESRVSSLKGNYASNGGVGNSNGVSSKDVLDMYNQGYKTKEIVRESRKNSYQVRSFKDIATNVAEAISAGAAYLRDKYNGVVATALGATEQLINDYVSGKSYAEIKENLKQRTNGMKVSDSTILRVMHNYEKQTGSKVVGKRNGNGKPGGNGKEAAANKGQKASPKK